MIAILALPVYFDPREWVILRQTQTPSISISAYLSGVRRRAVAYLSMFAGGITSLSVLGCTVGPEYSEPKVDSPERWSAIGAAEVTGDRFPDSAWWAKLDTNELTSLIERAVASNLSLEIAKTRVREARAVVGMVRGGLGPSLNATASYDRINLSENFPALSDFIETDLVDENQELFSVGFDAGWEIDIFGGTRRAVESASALADARIAEHRDVLLSVVAETARSYFELRLAQSQLTLLENEAAAQQKILELARDRVSAGVATQLDVTREIVELDGIRAAMPELHAAAVAAVMRLAVLTVQDGGELWEQLADAPELPEAPMTVPVGLPGELLRRRADVRAAERSVQAASAQIGVAVADLYPSFFLTGAVGQQSADFSTLFSGGSSAWSIGPSVRWPIFQGGSLRARVDAAEARYARAIFAHQRTVRAAIADAEASLTRYAQARLAYDRLRDAAGVQREAVRLAQKAYDDGLSDLEPVLRAQRVLYALDQQVVRARVSVLVSLASLNKALGGGWPEDVPPDIGSRGYGEDGS